MRIDRVTVGALDTNCWIVSAAEDAPAIVIDPGDDADRILEALADRPVAAVVLTHGHFDHLGAAGELIARTNAPLCVHEADAPRISDAVGTGGAMFGFDEHVAPAADRVLVDGDVIEVAGLTLEVIHTPGHTQGGICLLATTGGGGAAHLFSGDTLFSGSVGRTDFPGGDAHALSASIATRLSPLAPETTVHPGHGPDTTIQRESRINPFWPRS